MSSVEDIMARVSDEVVISPVHDLGVAADEKSSSCDAFPLEEASQRGVLPPQPPNSELTAAPAAVEPDAVTGLAEEPLLPSVPTPMKRSASDPTTANERIAAAASDVAVQALAGGGGSLRGIGGDGRNARASSLAATKEPTSPRKGKYPHLHSFNNMGNHNSRQNSPAIETDVIKWVTDLVGGLTDGQASASAVDLETGLIANSSAATASDTSKDMIPTFLCSICFENRTTADAFHVNNCAFNHIYCLPCMSAYASTLVEDGVIDHFCPGVAECHAALTMSELEMLLFPEAFAKLERFVEIKKNPLYRECPQCNTGASVATRTQNGEQVPIADVQCATCKYVYCFFHNNAHIGMTCAEYARRQSRRARRDNLASEQLVSTTTKLCPQCRAATEKAGGCNHMTCQHCRVNWCWLCSSVLTDVTEHYKRGNIFGCPGAQFITAPNNRMDPFAGCCRCFSWCQQFSCWNSACCISIRNTYNSFLFWLNRLGRLFVLVVTLPIAFVGGLACCCGCWPLFIAVVAVISKCRRYDFLRGLKDIPALFIGGALFVLGILDIVLLFIPCLLYILSYILLLMRFGSEGAREMLTNDDGERIPFWRALIEHIISMSVAAWVSRLID